MTATKTERINLRVSADALDLIRTAANLEYEDLTSFILGAAMDRARAVHKDALTMFLTPADMAQVEAALAAEPHVVPELANLLRKVKQRTMQTSPAQGPSEPATPN